MAWAGPAAPEPKNESELVPRMRCRDAHARPHPGQHHQACIRTGPRDSTPQRRKLVDVLAPNPAAFSWHGLSVHLGYSENDLEVALHCVGSRRNIDIQAWFRFRVSTNPTDSMHRIEHDEKALLPASEV